MSIDPILAEKDKRAVEKVDTLFRFASMVITLATLWWLLSALDKAYLPPSPRPQPAQLDVAIVQKRYSELRKLWWTSTKREEIHRLLGSPTQAICNEPELRAFEIEWERYGRGLLAISDERVWDKSVDPNDSNRWVAVLYRGRPPWYLFQSEKKGF